MKFGRQEIVKGTEMLLGDSDFYSGTAHDGALANWNFNSFDLDVWWTRPFQSSFGVFGFPDHQSINFYGAWADFKKIPAKIGVSAYLLYYEDGVQAITPVRRAFYTLGGRANHDVMGKNGFFWSGELAFESGDFNTGPGLGDTGSISASGFEGTFGFNLHSGSVDNRFHAFYAMATGDKDATDDNAKSFDPLFQDSHYRYGLSDMFTFSDLTVANLGWSMSKKDMSVGADVWGYTLTEKDPVSNEDALGSEIDGWWKYQYGPNTQIMAGLAYFMPGKAIDATVASGNADAGMRAVANLRLRF